MNFIDIIILLPLIWLGFKGLKKGLVIEIASLVALILGVYFGINFSDYASVLIKNNFNVNSKYLPIVSFSITFLVVVIGVFTLGKILEKIVSIVALGMVNKLLGLAFGIIKGLLILGVIITIVDSIDKRSGIISPETKNESLFYEPLLSLSQSIIPNLEDSLLFFSIESENTTTPTPTSP